MRRILPLLAGCLFFLLTLASATDYTPSGYENTGSANTVSPNLSHLHVRDFCQDSLGYMWIATARGLNRYNGYDFKQFFHDKENVRSLDNDMIYSLFLDSRHRLWVGTSTGVNRYDFENDRFIRYDMPYAYVHTFYENREGEIWVGTTIGVGRIDESASSVHIFPDTPPAYKTVSTLLEDSRGNQWAGSGGGLIHLHPDLPWELFPLPGDRRVNCLCLDPQGIFMIGTNSGIVFFDPSGNRFLDVPETLTSGTPLNSLYIHFIREIAPLRYLIGTSADGLFLYDALRQTLEHNPFEYSEPLESQQPICCKTDNQGNVWIGSFDKGFAVYNTQHSFFNRDPRLNHTFQDVFTTRIIEDRYRNLWIGTRYKGLYHYGKDGEVRIYDSSDSLLFKRNNNLVEELFIDSRDRLWIVGANRIMACTFDRAGNISRQRLILLEGSSGAASITEDERGNIWFGLASGLFLIRSGELHGAFERIYAGNIPKVYRRSGGEILFSAYGKGLFQVDDDLSVRRVGMPAPEAVPLSRHCVDLFEDSQNRLWLGTYNEGTMYIKGSEYRIFGMSDGLPCNDITCIQADREGNIWLSTANGLSRIAPDFSVANYFEHDGTQGNQYHEKATLARSDGTLFFTGNHGLTFFDPRQIVRNSHPAPIVIEDLKIHNESVRAGERSSILTRVISFAERIVLNHRHSLISIDYSGIDFLVPHKLTYAYKLEGFDAQWNRVGDHRRATYSNLTPGHYRFMVTAFNNDGLESVRPAVLEIDVKPAPWATWWAWLLYFAVFCAAIYTFMRLWTKIKLQKQSLEMESYEREREREVTEMKMTFYTNISHELRTPLTLISAPVQQLLGSTDPDSREGELLQTISRNRNRLHRLIDQLLDFRKMEDGVLALKTSRGNLTKTLASIIDPYLSTASEKKIDIRFEPYSPDLEMWFDPDKIEKIMHNLLSNAMKHTPANGRISITTRRVLFSEVRTQYEEVIPLGEQYVEITVSDTGPGLPPDKLGELFVRYRQIESATGLKPDYAGTGIGLHYTKRLTETHHGGISASIAPEGGMNFSVLLPLEDVYAPSEKNIGEKSDSGFGIVGDPETDHAETEEHFNPGAHDHTVLIAEDNIELMVYFRQMLGDRYNILEAPDGARAWKIMQEKCPDLVLSDVVMPELSGYELCTRIKQDPALSHIPVVLLTAKTSMSEQIEGLSHGADAYICKPFNVDYLLLTIENSLRNRERLRTFYSTPKPADGPEEPPVRLNMLDQRFMDKLMELLENELSDPNLNIDNIAREMAFSRTSFYRKLKGLTDTPPADFIRNYRLKRAAEMIQEGSWTLYEVAERSGFGNYTHFSVLFKKHFGISPRNYKENSKNET